MPDALKILFLSAEAEPFVKVGGLADVAGSLPLAIRKLNAHDGSAPDVRLVIPYHRIIQDQNLPVIRVARFAVPHVEGSIPVEGYLTHLDGLPVYLIASDLITADEQIYHADASVDGQKYTLFSLAALELARHIHWAPDILHANDWHTALSIYALSLKKSGRSFFRHVIGLFGVHNMPYLGVGAGSALAPFGLSPASRSALPWWAQDMPLPMGLLAADHIVTVSPSYAQEILTPDFASGLHDFLQSRSQHISGILNGLDVDRWNPATDSALHSNYTADDLEARRANKTALQAELGLPIDSDIPLLTMVTRLDPQKGVDLLPDALLQTVAFDYQVVILGTGSPELEEMLRSLETIFPNRLRALIRFDPGLSRRIYSAADAILIPSRYEPCGLTQMIGMRYGCVPIAHATGGLRDTIFDYTDFSESTGFLFKDLSSEGLAAVMRRALHVYAQPELWHGLQIRGMQKDFSWEISAKKYLNLYCSLLSTRTGKKAQKEKP